MNLDQTRKKEPRSQAKDPATAHPEMVGKAQLVWTLIVATMVVAVSLHHLSTSNLNREPSSESISAGIPGSAPINPKLSIK